MMDADVADGTQGPITPTDQARAKDALDLIRIFRNHSRLSDRVNSVRQRFLPPVPEALDGIDHFVLGSDRIADDVAGRLALREWVERGGSLWVMLDLVNQDTMAALLGDSLGFQVVDRVSLTRIQILGGPANSHRIEEVQVKEVEDPVDFARVLVPRLPVLYTLNGWPAAFLKEVGRGRVLFTTLGARGWMRERTELDPKPTHPEFSGLPVPLVPVEPLAIELHPRTERPLIPPEDIRSYVTQQISYAVVGRNTVVVVFGMFFLTLVTAAVTLGRKGMLEHLGWLAPALALGAAGFFVGLGEWSRDSIPPTVAVAQFVEAVSGVDEVQTSGMFAVYRPSWGALAVGAEKGGRLDLDLAGLEGRVYRRVQTDLDRWHWENLELPAGIRGGAFRHTLRTQEPMEAKVRFGPNGVEGRVASGPFGPLEDTIISLPGHHLLAAHMTEGGSFRSGSEDELHGGQVITGRLLNDQQRARQGLMEKLLAKPQPRSVANRSLLLAWAKPIDMHFTLAAEARTAGAALLTIPLQFEQTPPGTQVLVPGAFVDCRRIIHEGRSLPPMTESVLPTTVRLRFQIPGAVRPLVLSSTRLTVRLNVPSREVRIFADGDAAPLRQLSSPSGLVQVEITDPRLLRPDGQGALFITFHVGESRAGITGQNLWQIESVGLDLRGRTAGEGKGEHESR